MQLIYHYKPLKLFLLIGINDIFDGVVPYEPGKSPKRVAQNIFDIVDSIRYHSKETEIFIQTILPVNEEEFRINRGFYPKHDYPLENQILEINSQIVELGFTGEYSIIDLHPLFMNEEGRMSKELAKDGLHLNQNGYKVWCSKIKEHVENWLMPITWYKTLAFRLQFNSIEDLKRDQKSSSIKNVFYSFN